MKINQIPLLLLFFVCTLSVHAQNKVGDNPSVIQPGSLLELESLTKGLRLPRIPLNDVNLWTLDGVGVSGMMIYNELGTEPKGLYYWSTDSNKWVQVVNKDELPALIAAYNAANTTVTNKSTGNTLVTTVNGVVAAPTPIVNTNTLTGAANKITSTVNGKVADLAFNSGTVLNTIGFAADGKIVMQDSRNLTLEHSITNDNNNKIVSTINGNEQKTPIISGNTLIAASSSITSIVNGVLSNSLTPQDGTLDKIIGFTTDGQLQKQSVALIPITNTLEGSSSTFTSVVNGVRAPLSFKNVIPDQIIGFDANGEATRYSSSNSLSLAAGQLSSTVNGKISNAVAVLSSADNGLKFLSGNVKLGGSLSEPTIINTASNTLTIQGADNLKLLGLATTGINDNVVVYDPIVGNLKLFATNNKLTITSDGKLTSTVNDKPSTVQVLTNGSNGLSTTIGGVKLGGSLLEQTTIDATNFPLTILGSAGFKLPDLSVGAASDKVVVTDANGILKAIVPTNQLSSSDNQLRSTVNGKESQTVNIVNSIGISGKDNSLVATVNTATATYPVTSGDIKNVVGFDIDGKLVKTEYTVMPVENNLESAANSLTSTVNGKAKSATIINGNVITIDKGQIKTYVNGVQSTNYIKVLEQPGSGLSQIDGIVSLGGVLSKPATITTDATTNTLSIGGLAPISGLYDVMQVSADGKLGKQTLSNLLDFKIKPSTTYDNVVDFSVGGTIQTFNPVRSVITTINAGQLTTTVNGVISDPVSINAATTNLIEAGLGKIKTTVNGQPSEVTLTNSLTSSGNILSSSIAGGTAVTTNVINTSQTDNKTVNQIFTTINGIPSTTSATIISSNNLGANAGSLVSTINGVLAAFPVNNGLTIDGTAIKLGGLLTGPTALGTNATNTLSITGLGAGATTDKLIVADASGVLKTIIASSTNTLGAIVARDANGDFTANNITAVGNVAINSGNLTSTATTTNVFNTSTTLNLGAASGTTTVNNNLAVTGVTTLNGDVTVAPNKNFSQSGSGTFTTGTGAVTLKGATTIEGTTTLNTLTTASAAENVVTVGVGGVLHQRALDLGVTPIRVEAGSCSIVTTDYTVVLKGATADANFTLPTADVAGRTFRIINLSGHNIILSQNVRTAVDITTNKILSGNAFDGTILGNKMTLQWDGSEWIQVGN